MRRIARLVTICLLLMAVPVKGAVAAGMMMRGQGQERMTAAMVVVPAEVAGANATSHHHDHASHDHVGIGVGERGHDAGTGDHASPAKQSSVKCSICAACCVGGAILVSSEVSVPASAGTFVHFPALDIHLSWTVLAALERPPRIFLV